MKDTQTQNYLDIEQSFSNRLAVLEEKCRQLFGMQVNKISYDHFSAIQGLTVLTPAGAKSETFRDLSTNS